MGKAIYKGQEFSSSGIASTSYAGLVKPDGVSILVDLDGTVHSGSGMVDKSTEFGSDGKITETTGNYTSVTEFKADGSIEETITLQDGTVKLKTTTFNADGSISETIEEVEE